MGPYDPEDVFFVVQGEMEYGNQLGEVFFVVQGEMEYGNQLGEVE